MPTGTPHWRSLALAAALLAAPALRADAVLFASDFPDGSAPGWEAYGDSRPARLSVADGALQVSAPIAFRGIRRELPDPVELQSGEAAVLSFLVRLPPPGADAPSGFRFGLFAPSARDEKLPGTDHGYVALVDLLPTSRLRLQQDGGGTGFDPLSGRLRPVGQPGPDFALQTQTWLPVRLEVLRVDDITTRLSVSFGDVAFTRELISGRAPVRIGSVYIGAGNNNASFRLDDISLIHGTGR